MSFDNLIAYSLQAAALIAVGMAVPFLFRVNNPRWHLPYLQCLLLLTLLLPVVQPWRKILTPPQTSLKPTPAISPLSHERTQPGEAIRWRELLLPAIALGIAVRLAILVAGLIHLRSYRHSARPLPPFWGTPVGLSDQVSGPVTFGWLSPIILLPSQTLALADSARESILLHEWIHVRRADWPLAIAEEILLCFFWFHPAFWLLIDHIRLTREKLVDSEVRLEASTEDYVNALLSMAGLNLQPYIAPAAPFLRRSQISARIQTLISEVSMSRSRVTVSYAAATILSLSVALWAASATPLQQMAPEPNRISARGAEIIAASPSASSAVQPPAQNPAGSVSLDLTLDANGNVTDARVLSGPQPVRRQAIKKALDLKFKPGPSSAYVDLEYEKSTNIAQVPSETQASKLLSPIAVEMPPLAAQAQIRGTVRIEAIIAKDGTVRQMTLRSGHPLLVQSAIEAVRAARYQPTLLNGNPVEVATEIVIPFPPN